MAYVNSLTIDGLRGVSGELPLHLAIPNGNPGSGLTVIVGANNSGKSTVVEAFEALSRDRGNPPSFSTGKRNAANPDHLNIYCTFDGEEQRQNWLELIRDGSETHWLKRDVDSMDIRVVPSRRGFEPYFNRAPPTGPEWYYRQRQRPRYRPQALDSFDGRIFKINEASDRENFDRILGRIMGTPPSLDLS